MAHPDSLLLFRLEGIEINPVFVMGQHRSGTTILYKVLADTGHFNITSVFHILNRDRLLYLHENRGEKAAREELRQKFESLGLTDREFDSIKISDQTPEEYAYALPHQGRKPRLNWENLDAFYTFCRKIQFIQDPSRPLLLKNPFDAANFVFVARAFPTARFIFIHRDPVHVVNSQIKAVRSLLVSKNEYVALVVRRYQRLWGSHRKISWARWLLSDRWPFLFRQVASEVRNTNRYFVRHATELPENRFVSLTYRELCRRPAAVIGQVLDFLDAPRPDTDFDEQVSPRPVRLLPEVSRREQRILQQNESYCRNVGILHDASPTQ